GRHARQGIDFNNKHFHRARRPHPHKSVDAGAVEVLIIEVNSLPGMTPATCIFHQTALAGYTPYQFIDRILDFGQQRAAKAMPASK
ncbi:MAG: hypothetical protein EOO57_20215, partial [Hymenobacter sp.]